MSTYKRKTKHPETGEWQIATWIDDYYGPHEYGVSFPDGKIFHAEDYEWETSSSGDAD